MPLLIAVSGKLGSGKDYIVENILLPMVDGTVSKMAFADHIKVNVSSQNDDVDLLECLQGDKSMELRRKLQLAGTEQGRDKYGPDMWVTTLENWIRLRRLRDGTPDVVLVTDCRFPNEVSWVEKHGGLLIRVNAPARNEYALQKESKGDKFVYESIKTHMSEIALDTYMFGNQVDNDPEHAQTVLYQVKKIVNHYILEHVDRCHHFNSLTHSELQHKSFNGRHTPARGPARASTL